MIFALLVILVGAVVLAGWVQLLATRAIYVDSALVGQQRRIALLNSRELAREYALEALPTGSIAATNYTLAGNWGGFSVGTASSSLLSTSAQPSSVNPFSPGERSGYATDLQTTLSDGSTNYTCTLRARSRSPIYAGYLLVPHLPASSIASGINVQGPSLLWSTSASYAYTATSYQAPGARTALIAHGASIMPFPFIPLTSGSVSGFAPYAGYLSGSSSTATINDATDYGTPADTTDDGIGITDSGTQRTVTLDLSRVNLYPYSSQLTGLIRYRMDASAVSGITSMRLILQGTGTSSLPPLLITYEPPSTLDLTSIVLQGNNSRRLFLFVKKSASSSIALTTASSASWRLGGSFQNSPLACAPGGALTITGGLRSNGDISSTGTINLQAESDPAGLESIADRVGWLEIYRTP